MVNVITLSLEINFYLLLQKSVNVFYQLSLCFLTMINLYVSNKFMTCFVIMSYYFCLCKIYPVNCCKFNCLIYLSNTKIVYLINDKYLLALVRFQNAIKLLK